MDEQLVRRHPTLTGSRRQGLKTAGPSRRLALLAAAVVSVALAPTQVHAATNMGEFETRLMHQVNDVRSDAGLSEIRHDSCVDRMAERWASHIVSTGVLQHRDQGVILRRCDQVWAGENLVRGTQLTAAAMVRAWMASPPHREILMKERARGAGVAVSRDAQGRYIGVLNVTRRR